MLITRPHTNSIAILLIFMVYNIYKVLKIIHSCSIYWFIIKINVKNLTVYNGL